MVGFVDDATEQTNTFYNNRSTPEEILKLMQYDAQLWSGLLWLSDGAPVMVSKRAGPPLKV
eukprot:15338418-Ditylum_brightwellii.AAC.1